MSINNIVWIHGKYLTALCRGYGGGERSRYILQLISDILTARNITHVVYAEPFARKSQCGIPLGVELDNEHRIVAIDLTSTSVLSRLFIWLLGKTRIINYQRSALRVLTLNPKRKDLETVVARVDDDTLVVIDGMAGARTALPLLHTIKKRAAAVIYLSHNFEADYYIGLRSHILKLEQKYVSEADLVIAASVRDTERYKLVLNAKDNKIVSFPNVFPDRFRSLPKRREFTMAIVAGSFADILSKLAFFIARNEIVDTLIYIGKLRADIRSLKSSRTEVIHYEFIPERDKYLSILSQAHVGLNYCTWLGGSNVKRFDYALASLAILSGGTGYRGEILPGEAAFTDIYDLISKIRQLTGKAIELGAKNREYALKLHNNALVQLRGALRDVLGL